VAVVPTPPTFVSAISSVSELNQLTDTLNFLLYPPIFRGIQTVAQTLTTGVWGTITLDTETVDQADGAASTQHSNVTNNSRFTAAYAGWYQVSGTVAFAGSATGRRGVRYAVNGAAVAGTAVLIAAGVATGIATPGSAELLFLNIGDYVEMQAFQDTGVNLNTDGATGSRMNVEQVSI